MANEIFTAEDVAKLSDAELVLALKAAAIGSGDLDCARVINEAAKRLTKCGKDVRHHKGYLVSCPLRSGHAGICSARV